MNQKNFGKRAAFPSLPYEKWKDTKNTLHLCLQIVGKVRLALFPRLNHWWHVPLYVSTRGLTTRPIPYGYGNFEIEFNFIEHRVKIAASSGLWREFTLYDGLSVSEFHRQLFENLNALGIKAKIKPVPYEAPSDIPFPDDKEHKSYDIKYVDRFRRVLIGVNDVFEEFRGRFTGKSTPVHVFWHSFDLALTRFSGKEAPVRKEAGMVEREAYSHEVISFGFWAGDENFKEPAFYSYTAPEPENLTKEKLKPAEAFWNTDKGAMAILKYEDVRRSDAPRDKILEFLESAYRAGAKRAGWDAKNFVLKQPKH